MIQMDILNRPLILASKSPRRQQLLKQAGFNFIVKTQNTPEDYPENIPKMEVAPFLAQKKARASKHFITTNEEIIIAADSVVLLNEVIYEKPKDFEDAVRILQILSGNKHQVITGVCLLSNEKEVTFSGVSEVDLMPLSEAEIHYYVRKYQPYDKAGAYAIQEWIGLCKIRSIYGTYANIMGLPVDLVYEELRKF